MQIIKRHIKHESLEQGILNYIGINSKGVITFCFQGFDGEILINFDKEDSKKIKEFFRCQIN